MADVQRNDEETLQVAAERQLDVIGRPGILLSVIPSQSPDSYF